MRGFITEKEMVQAKEMLDAIRQNWQGLMVLPSERESLGRIAKIERPLTIREFTTLSDVHSRIGQKPLSTILAESRE